MQDEPELVVRNAEAWLAWLNSHHADIAALWLVLAKKKVTDPTNLTYHEALNAAVRYGWIDGQRRSRDSATFVQRYTPRGKRSVWSQRNVALAERLIAAGLMHEHGLAEVTRARADGRWAAAYPSPSTAEIPSDLAAALRAEPPAQATFARLTSQNRYAILYRIATVKRAKTRARRIEQFVAMLGRGETIHAQSGPR
ncbi:MAG: YdeI/OmpD-associated family protein [Candidatus Dormibacteria bacterium]